MSWPTELALDQNETLLHTLITFLSNINPSVPIAQLLPRDNETNLAPALFRSLLFAVEHDLDSSSIETTLQPYFAQCVALIDVELVLKLPGTFFSDLCVLKPLCQQTSFTHCSLFV
jgi:hypothetical protein